VLQALGSGEPECVHVPERQSSLPRRTANHNAACNSSFQELIVQCEYTTAFMNLKQTGHSMTVQAAVRQGVWCCAADWPHFSGEAAAPQNWLVSPRPANDRTSCFPGTLETGSSSDLRASARTSTTDSRNTKAPCASRAWTADGAVDGALCVPPYLWARLPTALAPAPCASRERTADSADDGSLIVSRGVWP